MLIVINIQYLVTWFSELNITFQTYHAFLNKYFILLLKWKRFLFASYNNIICHFLSVGKAQPLQLVQISFGQHLKTWIFKTLISISTTLHRAEVTRPDISTPKYKYPENDEMNRVPELSGVLRKARI